MPNSRRSAFTAPYRPPRHSRPAAPRRAVTALAAAALLSSLVAAVPSATAGQPDSGSLQRAFSAAAARYHVPVDVLLGVAYLESRWDDHGGAPSVSGGYGPLHLTDARAALVRDAATAVAPGGDLAQDVVAGRGDAARPQRPAVQPASRTRAAAPARLPARLTTLPRAAALTGLPAQALRTDPSANVSGGAALLAAEQRRLGLPASADPARWYAAVAHYADPDGGQAATGFADDVYEVLRTGAARTTDAGQRVRLTASPGLTPDPAQATAPAARAGTAAGARPAAATAATAADAELPLECPRHLTCEAVPAPYAEFGDGDYGNHDKADRPKDESIDSIVIHSTEGSWETTLKLIKDPTYVSWNYTIRSADGLVAQHVPTKDVAWHAGNWYVNAHSIGIEHEGFLAAPDAWFTESMYRASARLVRYLADRYDIPLDRRHILGHDNVPGTTAATVSGMHTDPGPYWDWAHYFTLLGRPFHASAGPRSQVVTIRPDYSANKPAYTGCEKAGQPCAPHGAAAVMLRTEPRESAPLVQDLGLHPDGSPSTSDVNDVGARATTGQQYAVAERRGDWTAVWYLGQKAWFHNPRSAPTAVPTAGRLLSPRPGLSQVPVYGRAYPEASAYPQGVPVQAVSPLPYRILPGQSYVVGGRVSADYLYAPTFDVSQHTVVHGKDTYYEVQLGHRVAYVRAADVVLHSSRR
ncbi:N-acetylmuramoyl-L-alanine amidase [Streptomyces sp. NPDC059740]|uniref:N-acetylmuramoyl-L-alanine amidase n=1 Tax=Streptomyces sp. NPDC059740 TaxID=3346926 RepID=UPI00364B8240